MQLIYINSVVKFLMSHFFRVFYKGSWQSHGLVYTQKTPPKISSQMSLLVRRVVYLKLPYITTLLFKAIIYFITFISDDHSRVRLTTGPYENDMTFYGGYINANYIKVSLNIKNYVIL